MLNEGSMVLTSQVLPNEERLNMDASNMLNEDQLNMETSQVLSNKNSQVEFYDDDSNDVWGEDETSYGDAKDLSDSSVLNREWERRHSQFHTMGYRDGITAGKEDSAQEGFNHGYKESVYAGYSWGLVRGISSVMSTFPNQLKEKLISDLRNIDRFRKLHESTRAISSINALQIFYSSIQKNGSGDSHEHGEDSSCNQLDALSKDLNFLLSDSAELKVDLKQIKDSAIDG